MYKGHGVNVNCEIGEHKSTPLMLAAHYGYADIVKTLIDEGAKVNVSNDYPVTALSCAVASGHSDIVLILIGAGADVNVLVEKDHYNTPLMVATMKGYINIVSILLDAGADPTIRNIHDKSAASIALEKGFQKIANMLYDAERSFEVPDLQKNNFNFADLNEDGVEHVKYTNDTTSVTNLGDSYTPPGGVIME